MPVYFDTRAEHVQNCVILGQEKLERDPQFYSKVFTGGETWVYSYPSQ
jgi:hypothetical protein